jgi:hypothetical protein
MAKTIEDEVRAGSHTVFKKTIPVHKLLRSLLLLLLLWLLGGIVIATSSRI